MADGTYADRLRERAREARSFYEGRRPGRVRVEITQDEAEGIADFIESMAFLLDHIYPESVFDGSSGDPGAVAVAKARTALAVLNRRPAP